MSTLSQFYGVAQPPIANGLMVGSNGIALNGTTSSTSFVDLVNYTGAGMLTLFYLTDASAGAMRCEVIIDGVTIYANTSATTASVYNIVGGSTGVPESIPFKQSLQLKYRTSNGSYPVTGYYKYWKYA